MALAYAICNTRCVVTTSESLPAELVVLGRSMARWRLEAGLTQLEMSRRLGRKPLAISQWENGYRSASVLDMMRFAKECGIPVSVIYRALDSLPVPPLRLRKTAEDDTSRPMQRLRGPSRGDTE